MSQDIKVGQMKIAEDKIQRILIDLEMATGNEIDNVRVDTRRFANLHVEIFLRDGSL